MKNRLNAFLEAHPGGWNHVDWLGLLAQLERDGVDVGDREAVGGALEAERLTRALAAADVKGLGPKRIEAIVERFRTLWHLRQATAADIATIRTVPMALAQRIVEAMGGSGGR